jgi:tRNA wybutosine-synthesizing protein 3
MFSWGNLSEKLRMGNLECKDEVIVDLFAGIGYFTLPFLVR